MGQVLPRTPQKEPTLLASTPPAQVQPQNWETTAVKATSLVALCYRSPRKLIKL